MIQFFSISTNFRTSPKYHPSVAIAVVIANMVGTGVFTSLGLQVKYSSSVPGLLFIWAIGGVVSLCGAFAYGELNGYYPRSGGEYLYLSKIYHPILGFLSGWISLVVGISAPICAISMAISEYLFDNGQFWFSLIFMVSMASIHGLGIRVSGLIQNFLTAIKFCFLIFICAIPLFLDSGLPYSIQWRKVELGDFINSELLIPFVFVYYSYSGWNASVYISGQLQNAKRWTVLSLILGTSIVTIVYIVLHYIFLSALPIEQLSGVIDVGNVIIPHLLGQRFKTFFSFIFGFMLLSSLSSLFLVGPRILEVMGQDYKFLKNLGKTNRFGCPFYALLFQLLIAILLLLTSSFELILQYIGVTLSIFSTLAVIGVAKARRLHGNRTRGLKVLFYPIPLIIFAFVNLSMIVYNIVQKPMILFYVAITLLLGFAFYLFSNRMGQR